MTRVAVRDVTSLRTWQRNSARPLRRRTIPAFDTTSQVPLRPEQPRLRQVVAEDRRNVRRVGLAERAFCVQEIGDGAGAGLVASDGELEAFLRRRPQDLALKNRLVGLDGLLAACQTSNSTRSARASVSAWTILTSAAASATR